MMDITTVSDLHGFYPKLEGGDLLIVAGDLTARDEPEQHEEFCEWLDAQAYTKKIVIAGNHDNNIDGDAIDSIRGCVYLEDTGIACGPFMVWGIPWTAKFPGINPNCCAFTLDNDDQLKEKWDLIPEDTDILITHCPPWGIFDEVKGTNLGTFIETGSRSLRNKVMGMPNLKLHVFGHIHEHGGKILDTVSCKFVNASYVNERYKPVNKPVRIELCH